MEFLSSISEKVLGVTANVIVAIAVHVPFLLSALLSSGPISQIDSPVHITPTTTVSSTEMIQNHIQKIRPPAVVSSSTVQTGEFTIVVDCSDQNPNSVEIIRNGKRVQNLPIDGSLTGVGSCPKADIQDINFDNYSDFMVASANGTGGAGYRYWLYSSSTREFSCPEGNYGCELMNPSFDSQTGTVTTYNSYGADDVVTDIYHILNGKLILFKRVEDVSPAIPSQTKTSVYVPAPIERSSLGGGEFVEDQSPDKNFVSHSYNSEQGDAGVYITTSSGTVVTSIYCGYFKQWLADSKSIIVFVPDVCGNKVPPGKTFQLFVDGRISY